MDGASSSPVLVRGEDVADLEALPVRRGDQLLRLHRVHRRRHAAVVHQHCARPPLRSSLRRARPYLKPRERGARARTVGVVVGQDGHGDDAHGGGGGGGGGGGVQAAGGGAGRGGAAGQGGGAGGGGQVAAEHSDAAQHGGGEGARCTGRGRYPCTACSAPPPPYV